MRKTVSSFLAGLIALLVLPTLLAAPAHAADQSIACSGGGTFTVSGTTVTGNQSCTGAITIPANVELFNNYVFYDSGVTSVTFEPGSKLKNIAWGAFLNSKLLTSIVLPNGLESLEGGQFTGTGVKTISIPGTVNQLQIDSFWGSIESVIFESRVATSLNIDEVSFTDLQSSVRSVTFKGPNQLKLDTPPGAGDDDLSLGWSTTSGGPLVDFPLANTNPGDLTLYPKLTPKTGVALVLCSLSGFFKVKDGVLTASTGDCAGEITIPADVTRIPERCCGGIGGVFANRNITKVTFEPGSLLNHLGGTTFLGTKFSTISIPGTIGRYELGIGAFADSDLESLTIESAENISEKFAFWAYIGSFERAHKLNSMTFMSAVDLAMMPPIAQNDYRHVGWSTSPGGQVIPSYPYSVAAGTTLYNIQTPIDIREIPCSVSGSFTTRDDLLSASTKNCSGEVTIPAYVTRIANSVFDAYDGRNITGVRFEANSQLRSIGMHAFADSNITSIELPNGLETIGGGAFQRLKAKNISIPGTVTTISGGAFHSAALESVVFESRVNPSIEMNGSSFFNNSKLRSVTFNGPVELNPQAWRVNSDTWNWLGWSATLGGTIVPFSHLSDNSGSITLFANMSPKTYNAIYDSKGGTPVEPGLVVGGQIQFPTPPTRVGYSFDAWYLGADPVTLWEQAGDVTLSANWIPNRYAVNLDSKGGSAVPATSFVTDGAITSAPAAPNRNCSALAGWSATDGGPAVSFPYEPKVMADITLFAKWSASPCAVTAGEAENSQVVTVPAGTTMATISATEFLPTVKLNLAGASGQAVVTVAPISNPATTSNTPFKLTESTKIVDINVTGITGRVTVCLDGGATDSLFHFTGGAWVALPERSYVNGQVCGVTSNFSPFAAAVSQSPAEKAAEAAAAEQARNAAAAAAEQARNAAATEQARIAAATAADLATRTVSAKKTLAPNALAKKVGVKIVSPKAKVTMSVAKSSKKNCAVVAGKLKTLKAGNCAVTFTVQEPKPKKGKQPKATKVVKTLVVK